MTNREINIIKLFMSEDYLSLDAISNQLNISKRTVSRSISSIRDELKPLGLDLKFNHRLGYKLVYEEERDLFELKKLLRHAWANSLESKILISLVDNQSLKIDNISYSFYSSAYEIGIVLKSVRKILNKYNLDYSSKPYQGIYITGSELDIRNLIQNEYMIYYNNILVDILIPGYDEQFVDRIKNICRRVLVKNSLIITDLDFSNLVSSIVISIYRKNNKIEALVQDYSTIIKDIVLEINEELHMNISLDEISYITSKTVLIIDKDQSILSDRVNKVILNAIEEINRSNPDYYIFDDIFYKALVLHVEYLMKRLNRHQVIENPLLNEIKQEYLVELNDAIKIGKNIETEFGIAINGDELGYLAIHLGSSKRNLYSKKKAIIICNYGLGTSQIVQAKVEQLYKGIEVIGVYPSVYIEMAVAQKPDFIITTMDLINYKGDILVIKAENILFDTDIKLDFKEDKFLDFFDEDLFFETYSDNKEEILILGSELIKNVKQVCPYILDKVLEREAVSSTAIGQLVAIPRLIDKYNAIVVLEDLNQGFKRGRFKVERQVYQKFEMALMNKLASLSFKNRDATKPGGVLNPLQLCKPVNAYSDLKGQNGIVFYLQAAYTSAIDPTTGFANLFNKNISEKDYKTFINSMKGLKYEGDEGFIFIFKYNDFSKTGLVRLKNNKDIEWNVSTRGYRVSYNKRKKEHFTINMTESLINLFDKYGIDYIHIENILDLISKLKDEEYIKVVKKVIEIFRYTLQLRNTTREEDYIISPVKNKDGYYFDSRAVRIRDCLPLDGDANGAFNIARKGLVYVNKLKTSDKDEVSPAVKNEDWFNYIM